MPVSQLRLRLAGGFALAFGLGLALLATGALGYLWRESHRRLDARLEMTANGVVDAMLRELRETPDSSMAYAANEVRLEWPSRADRWVLTRPDGVVLAATDSSTRVARVAAAARLATTARFALDDVQDEVEAIVAAGPHEKVDGHDWRFDVVAWDSTEGIEQDARLLATILAVATPLLVLFSLGAGYVLARGALQPARDLGAAIAATAADDLSRRLAPGDGRDEISALAREFNQLLDRLEAAQLRNQRFVREAAHQIRTPLTLVLGEAELVRAADTTDPVLTHAALQRIQTAATVIRHRVDELMLLAEAQAGTKPRLEEAVELDGLALECTDLMRARASALGRSLALGSVHPATVRGNEQLLREALLELLENGCRHARPSSTVTTDVLLERDIPMIRVSSECSPTPMLDREGSGLGMQIVTWIAQAHGGRFEVAISGSLHVATLTFAGGKAAPA